MIILRSITRERIATYFFVLDFVVVIFEVSFAYSMCAREVFMLSQIILSLVGSFDLGSITVEIVKGQSMPNMDLVGFSDCYVLAKWIPAESSGDGTLFLWVYFLVLVSYLYVGNADERAPLRAYVRDMYAQHCGYVCM